MLWQKPAVKDGVLENDTTDVTDKGNLASSGIRRDL
jgi:hypothetical protein